MDPNSNPLGGMQPAPAAPAAPTPAPTMPVMPTAAEKAASSDPVADLGNLANELNSYDPTADLAAMADGNVAVPVADPTQNLAAAAAPEVPPSPLDNIAPIAPDPSAVSPVSDMAAGPSFAPSADLTATATVSAAAAPGSMIGQPLPETPAETPAPEAEQSSTSSVADFNTESPETAASQGPAPTGKVTAAAPVPGSIGSAKSYADIQREEAERAAKAAAAAAAKKNSGPKKPISPTTIILSVVIGIVAIVGVVVAVIMINSNSTSSKPTSTATYIGGDDEPEEVETLICQTPMQPGDYAGMLGVLSAKHNNSFTFSDDELSAIKVELVYYVDSTASATAAKEGYDSQHPQQNQTSGELDDPEVDLDDASEEDIVMADSRESMETVTTTASDITYTYTRYVNSDNIANWLISPYYMPEEFGLSKNLDVNSYTMDDFKTAQNGLGYTCTITNE